MKILSNKKYNELILKSCEGMFGAVTDDMLLRENGLLYEENKQLKEEIEELKQAKLIMIDYQDLEQRNIDLNSILTELEEWLKKITDNYNSKWEQFITNQNATEDVIKRIDVKIEMLDQVLNKIQELKEKYK